MSGPQVERFLFWREMTYAVCNTLAEAIDARQAGGGPQLLPEAARRSARDAAKALIFEVMQARPAEDECWTVVEGEQRLTLKGMVLLTLLAVGYDWSDEEHLGRGRILTVRELERWEMGKLRVPVIV